MSTTTPDASTALAINANDFAGHTPGPWNYATSGGFDRSTHTKLSHYVSTSHVPDENGVCGLLIAAVVEQDNSEANARLIAAAPALLAENARLAAQVAQLRDALTACVKADDDNIGFHAACSKARAALAVTEEGSKLAASVSAADEPLVTLGQGDFTRTIPAE